VKEEEKLKGWNLLTYALFLGPFFLVLYFWETRKHFPAAKFYAGASLLLMILCAYLLFSITFNPFIIQVVYSLLFLAIFTMVFMYCWVLESKTESLGPLHKQTYSLSRAVAWLVVMSSVFLGLGNVIQAIYFWLFGEQIIIYFSSGLDIFDIWIFIGMIFGFTYGLRDGNDYFNRDLPSVVRSIFFVFFFISFYSGLILCLIIYPLQRLAPISYHPQSADFLFYVLLVIAISLSVVLLIQRASCYRILKSGAIIFLGIPLISLHIIVVTAYSTTIVLTVASILEDRRELTAAKTLYTRIIPHIRYDQLLASLYHRQGVLHVLNKDYTAAVASFKKVMADYSEDYEVYYKARRYVDSFESSQPTKGKGRKIISVRHQTFEQAASCFPNSLSVILNFYEDEPVSTRKLSYAVKESFSEGSFIWKVQSFLDANGYGLVTTFWQDKETLISLLEAGYPVLIYIPGHVYTLYGYDSRMEMFFTYDTAQSNRWSDKPFWDLQAFWMRSSFLMSVVVRKEDEGKFALRFPQLGRYGEYHRLWQKTQISSYYEGKENYWRDYDRYSLSEALGFDRLKINDPTFLDDDFFPFSWDAEKWRNEILPVLSRPSSIDWRIVERYLYYLLNSREPAKARHLIELYESHLIAEGYSPFPDLLKMKLAIAVATGNSEEALSISDKLIGISTGDAEYVAYWGHYIKGRHLMSAGDFKNAATVLLSALSDLNLEETGRSQNLRPILYALNEINRIDSSAIDPKKRRLIEVARIHFANQHINQDSHALAKAAE